MPKPQENSEEWLTTKDACAYLKVSQMTIFRWMKSGKLAHYKIGNALRFKQEDLDALANKVQSDHSPTIRCKICGGEEMVEGRLQSTGRVSFKPNKTKFWVFEESHVPVTTKMCTSCGHLELFADTEKMSRLSPEAKTTE
jgi:excisionase family DNA binding protein